MSIFFFGGGGGSILILYCKLLNGKLLKRQSDKMIRYNVTAQFVVHDENRSVYVLLPLHPQGPGRVPWKSKKNCTFQMAIYQSLIIE